MLFCFSKQKTAYEIEYGLVGSEMCIRDRPMNFGFTGKGNTSRPQGLADIIEAGAIGPKLSLIHILRRRRAV